MDRTELIEELADALQDRHDMDVPWSGYADAVVSRLEKLGILQDAARWQALRANKQQESDLSSGPGSPKALILRLEAAGCEKWLESGAPDFPATLDAIMDAEIAEQAAAP